MRDGGDYRSGRQFRRFWSSVADRDDLELCFFSTFLSGPRRAGKESTWDMGDSHTRTRIAHRWIDGAVWVIKDPRPWDSRGARSDAFWAEANLTQKSPC